MLYDRIPAKFGNLDTPRARIIKSRRWAIVWHSFQIGGEGVIISCISVVEGGSVKRQLDKRRHARRHPEQTSSARADPSSYWETRTGIIRSGRKLHGRDIAFQNILFYVKSL